MLFRVHVVVVTVFQRLSGELPEGPYSDGSECAVYHMFGINADGALVAAAQVARAAEHAVDRNGAYIGGIIVELHVRAAIRSEFPGPKYLIRDPDAPGIFYVTGGTYFSLPGSDVGQVAEAIAEARRSVAVNGLPSASFTHPPGPAPDPPSRVRIACPVCGQWTELYCSGMLFSFYSRFDPDSPEWELGQNAKGTLMSFLKEHLECSGGSGQPLPFLYEDDERYHEVDPAKRVTMEDRL